MEFCSLFFDLPTPMVDCRYFFFCLVYLLRCDCEHNMIDAHVPGQLRHKTVIIYSVDYNSNSNWTVNCFLLMDSFLYFFVSLRHCFGIAHHATVCLWPSKKTYATHNAFIHITFHSIPFHQRHCCLMTFCELQQYLFKCHTRRQFNSPKNRTKKKIQKSNFNIVSVDVCSACAIEYVRIPNRMIGLMNYQPHNRKCSFRPQFNLLFTDNAAIYATQRTAGMNEFCFFIF